MIEFFLRIVLDVSLPQGSNDTGTTFKSPAFPARYNQSSLQYLSSFQLEKSHGESAAKISHTAIK